MTTSEIAGPAFTLGGILLAGILGWVGSIFAKKMREPTRIETLWTRLDVQDAKLETQGSEIHELRGHVEVLQRKSAASGHIIRDLARQWPADGDVPRLNPDDLYELDEDTIPAGHPWRSKP